MTQPRKLPSHLASLNSTHQASYGSAGGETPKTKRYMGVRQVVLLQTAAVFSLWNLGLLAQFGPAVILLLIMVFVCFLAPVALVVSEMANMWPNRNGGIYEWANEALGDGFGFLCIWLAASATIPWYPVVLSFGIGAFSAAWHLHLNQHAGAVAGITVALFWFSTA